MSTPKTKYIQHIYRTILGGLLLLALTGCGSQEKAYHLDLSSEWAVASGAPGESLAEGKAKSFNPVDLNTNEIIQYLDQDTNTGYLWLKKEFTLPSELSGKNLSLILGKAHVAARVYLNGKLVGSGGEFPPQ